MKLRLALINLLILIFFVAGAQELPYAWNKSFQPIRVISSTSTGFVYNILDTHVDPSGNRLITGWFNGTIDLDPSAGTVSLTSTANTQDIFIAKYSATGALEFAKSIGNSLNFETGTSIHYQPVGDQIIVGGRFQGTIDFDPDLGVANRASAGGQDAFLLVLDKNGLFINAVNIGSTGADDISRAVPTSTGDIYVFGSFTGTTDVDPGAGVLNLVSQPTTAANSFIARYNNTLTTTAWAYSFRASIGGRLTVSPNNFYITTNFNTSADYNISAPELAVVNSKNGSADAIVAKYDFNANLVWLKTYGGDAFDSAPAIVIDASDKLYLAGNFTGSTDLDPNAGIANYNSQGEEDAYVMMWDGAGNLLWSKSWGGTKSEIISSVGLLSGNNLIVGGIFESASDLDPDAGVFNVTSNGLFDSFVSYYSSGGVFISGFSFGGQGNETAPVISTDGATKFELFSNYTNTTDFDPTTDVNALTVPIQNFPEIQVSTYYLLSPIPDNQPTTLVLNNPTSSSIDLSFTDAATLPSGYLVVRKAGSAPTTVPKDGRTYNPGDVLGDAIVVQSSLSNTFTISGLAAGTTYHFQVFSFSGSGLTTNYLTTSPLSGSSSTSTITFDISTDKQALLDLYNALGGPTWTNSTNWTSPAPVDNTWFGVTVSGGRVTQLNLPINNLVGQLPSSIGNLTALTQIDFHGNAINGQIPNELGNITGLQSLALYNNQFTGNIPVSLGNISALVYFDASNNKLSGTIPASFSNLNNLDFISFNANSLTGTIDPIKNLTGLNQIHLADNQLSGVIPAELGSISGLTHLNLSRNQFTGTIPTALTTITTLQSLLLATNKLTGSIPPSIGNLTSLTEIDLGQNQLSGTIPPGFINLINLTSIKFGDSGLSGAVPINSTFINLTLLDIRNNSFDALQNLSATPLTTLLVNNNNLTFEDLEPNITKLGPSSNYSPQKTFGTAQTFSLFSGQPLNLSFLVGGSNNIYQWKKNAVNVGVNSDSFSIPSVLSTDAATYSLTITNSVVTGLTLTSASQVVSVANKLEGLFDWVSAGDVTSEGIPLPSSTATDQNYGGQWGDFNNDGFEDIFISGIAVQERSYLYQNNGNGTFSKVNNNAYFYSTGRSVSWADYNNDGFLDFFAPGGVFAPDSIAFASVFKNNGNNTFSRILLPGNPATVSATWSDTDNDGDLDLIVSNSGAFVSIYRNDGGSFLFAGSVGTNANAQWNVVAADLNNDGKQDIYIPDDATRNLFFGNGNNTFNLIAGNSIVTTTMTLQRGASFADIDNDGDLDAYLTASTGSNMFYINNGSGSYTAQSPTLVLGEAVFGNRGSAFADYDNDGFIDLLTSQNTGTVVEWVLFKNNGNGTFSKQTSQSFRSNGQLVGASFGDYNNDGFLDVVSGSFGSDYNGIYRNKGNSNNWLQVKLTGKYSNRSAVGAMVDVYAGGQRRHQRIIANNGFANQNSLIVQVGLGASAVADSVKITWPNGFINRLNAVASNQRLNITEVNSDSLALVNLYNATGGPNWVNKSGWLTGPLNTWFGVTIRNKRVAKLQMYSNNISGPLPASIGDLTGLDSLILAGNKITGSIPSVLGNLKQVIFIDLGGNQLTGNFPASLFTLTQLKTFGFAGNQLTGTIPAAIGNLVNLDNLWLDRNKLSGAVPNEINNLVNLDMFYLNDNEFTSIPALTGFTLSFGGSVANNFLEFNSLVPNAAVVNLIRSPQKNFPATAAQQLTAGQPVTFTRAFLGAGNTYQWRKGTTNITGATSDTYAIGSLTPADNGGYTLIVSNPGLPGVTLQTDPFIVTVVSSSLAEESGYQFYKEIGWRAQNQIQITAGRDVAFDNANNLYILDSFDLNVKKFDPAGNLLSIIGGQGTNDGLFTIPMAIAFDANGNLFVVDFGANRIQKFAPDGSFIGKGGTIGVAPGQFRSPRGIAVDVATGNVYVADTGNNRIQVFDNNGNYQFSFGTLGTGNGQFNAPYKVYINSGQLYVSDRNNHRIQIFTLAGAYVSQFGSFGTSNGQFNGPTEMVVDTNGDILVCDALNYRVQRFNSSGVFVSAFGVFGNTPGTMRGPEAIAIASNGDIVLGDIGNGAQVFTNSGTYVRGYGNFGSALGLLRGPQTVVRDSKGNRYVLETTNVRVQKFDRNGNAISSFGSLGTGPGLFKFPQAMAIDRNDNIYVSESDNNTIQKFTSAGVYITTFGSTGTGDGQFNGIISMAFDQANNLWVLESINRRVQQLKPDGTFVSKFGVTGTGQGQLNSPSAITIDRLGKIYIAESNPSRIQKFEPDGTFITLVGGQAGNSPGLFNNVRGLSSDFLNNIYVGDNFNYRIQKLESNLSYLTKFGDLGTGNADLFNGPGSVHSNLSGDTLWISEIANRIQIWTARSKVIAASDSLALVAIYNSLGGANWTNKTNWLTGKVDTWFGVAVGAGRVRALNLPNNNLAGGLPAAVGSLTQLIELNLSNNKISSIPAELTNLLNLEKLNLSENVLNSPYPSVLGGINNLKVLKVAANKLTGAVSLPPNVYVAHINNNQLDVLPTLITQLDTLKAQANKFDFADLEPNVGIESFAYAPQDSVSIIESVLKQLGESAVFTATTGGTANQYQWKKNGANISGAINATLSLNNITFNDDGIYQASITSNLVPNLTLQSLKKTLRVSSLKRDSIALRGLYLLTNGPSWTTRTNWLTTPLSTGNWFGVTITNNRVSSVSLPNNNLVGRAPLALADLQNVTTLNLSNNKITFVPDLKTLTNATVINLSGNRLDFESIVPNSKIPTVNYSNQAEIGSASTDLIDFGTDFIVKIKTGGVGNKYQWKRNNANVLNATDTTYLISKIARTNMGDYVAEVTNPEVPGLTLKSANKRVLAVASVSGKVNATATTPASKGRNLLLRVTASNGYDTLGNVQLQADGAYKFEKVVLGDYQIVSLVDSLTYKRALPTYYKNTILWEEAEKIAVDENRTGLDINVAYRPTNVPVGTGVISGVITERVTGGRIQADKRVAGAGCLVRKVERTGRTEAEKLTLIGYVFSNANGEFTLPKLEKGEYRLNIQYPGYPMDETSFVTIPIGDGLQSQVKVAATVAEGKIKVQKLIVTGVWEQENYFAEAFPNPSTEYVQIKFNNESATRKVELMDMSGRKLLQQTAASKEVSVEVGSYQAGMYLLQVVDDDSVVKVIRIIKN